MRAYSKVSSRGTCARVDARNDYLLQGCGMDGKPEEHATNGLAQEEHNNGEGWM